MSDAKVITHPPAIVIKEPVVKALITVSDKQSVGITVREPPYASVSVGQELTVRTIADDNLKIGVVVREPPKIQVTVAPSIISRSSGDLLVSPIITGVGVAPTPSADTNTGQLATTAFVHIVTRYVHEQLQPSSTWIVNHGMHKYPNITILDSNNRLVMGDIEYSSLDTVTLLFSESIAGKAHLT